MTNWVRLWEDMPTDPKWRVIARRAGRPISEVLSVFVFMMTNAGSAADAGSLSGWDDEDVAAALDMDGKHVATIREAMEGKVTKYGKLIEYNKIVPPIFRARLPANIWMELRQDIFKRDNYTCIYCGSKGGRLECDHIFPVSRGGSHEASNLATSCFDCNRSKRDKLLSEWVR